MTCPLYRVDHLIHCDAVVEPVTPTLHERERFCCAADYAHCPTLRAMLRVRRPLREQEYLALWVTPSPDEALKER